MRRTRSPSTSSTPVTPYACSGTSPGAASRPLPSVTITLPLPQALWRRFHSFSLWKPDASVSRSGIHPVNAYTSGAGSLPGILYPPSALKYPLTATGIHAGPN